MPSGQTGFLDFNLGGIGIQVSHFLPSVKLMGSPAGDWIGNVHSVRMYVDPGAGMGVSFFRGSTSGSTLVRVSITGYYVDLTLTKIE